jgi:hypothetical protein
MNDSAISGAEVASKLSDSKESSQTIATVLPEAAAQLYFR